MFKDEDIKDIYREDTHGRKYHQSIVSKQKDKLEDEPGEVFSLSLKKPMTWTEFKDLTYDLKRIYILYLKDNYKVTSTDIRLMLGCSPAHFHRTLSNLDLIGVFPKGTQKRTKKEKQVWKEFLDNSVKPDTLKSDTPAPVKEQPMTSTKISEFHFTQSGPFNLDEFAKRLTAFIKNGDKCTITIHVSDEKESYHEI